MKTTGPPLLRQCAPNLLGHSARWRRPGKTLWGKREDQKMREREGCCRFNGLETELPVEGGEH